MQLCTNLGVLFRSLVLSSGTGGKLGALDGLQGLGQGARQGSARARFSPRLSLLETDLRIGSRVLLRAQAGLSHQRTGYAAVGFGRYVVYESIGLERSWRFSTLLAGIMW